MTEAAPSPPLKKFFCPCCNHGYVTSDEMINHIKQSPIKVKTYSCNVCLLEFFVKSDLIDHQRVDHQMAVSKKYKCDECDLDYNTAAQLARHKRMHDEIAQKLAANGIFIPRPGKGDLNQNAGKKDKKDQSDEGEEEDPLGAKAPADDKAKDPDCSTSKPQAKTTKSKISPSVRRSRKEKTDVARLPKEKTDVDRLPKEHPESDTEPEEKKLPGSDSEEKKPGSDSASGDHSGAGTTPGVNEMLSEKRKRGRPRLPEHLRSTASSRSRARKKRNQEDGEEFEIPNVSACRV